MQKITPLLWFDGLAEEAAAFYVSIFKDSKIENVSRFGDAGPGAPGSAMMVEFQLEGQDFMALNGGATDARSDAESEMKPGAVALFVTCETQSEVNYFWERLSADGEIIRCGWLRDKYGLAWNIVPQGLGELLGSPDREKANRAMVAMLQMEKLDIDELRRAFEGD